MKPSPAYWINKKVLVTGGFGFLGSHIVEELLELGADVTVFGRVSTNNDFISSINKRTRIIEGNVIDSEDALKACKSQDIVINTAAKVGGIEYNRMHQADMLRENIAITSSMFEAARKSEVNRFLLISSACIYPSDALIPTPETEGFKSEPEKTNAGYGWAKRISEKYGMYYHEQYGMNVGIVRPYNLYGPRDRFDPERSHVIPSLIRRVFEGENPLTVWGSGNQTRAFLFVKDAVQGLLLSIEKYPLPDPINIGTNEEITIHDLVLMIKRISNKNIRIRFDTSKPDGSPRRNSDNTKAKKILGFEASENLETGLHKTIEWYEAHN